MPRRECQDHRALLYELQSGLEKTLAESKDITEEEKLAFSNAIEDGIRHI